MGRRLVRGGVGAATAGVTIGRADPHDPAVAALAAEHKRRSSAVCGLCADHSLEIEQLCADDIRLWAAMRDADLLGVGALQTLNPSHGEVKAMFTVDAARGLGVGAALLRTIIAAARDAGMMRLSLETGTQDYFAAARRLYARAGFAECAPFAAYVADTRSVFMTRVLD